MVYLLDTYATVLRNGGAHQRGTQERSAHEGSACLIIVVLLLILDYLVGGGGDYELLSGRHQLL